MAKTKTRARKGKAEPKGNRRGWATGSEKRPRKRRSLVRRVVAGTAKGTGRLIAKGSVASARVVRNRSAKQRFPDGYMPEPDEIPAKAWHPSKNGGTCGCGRRFGSDAGLRRHYEVQHGDEEPAEKNVGRYHGAAATRFVRRKKKAVKTVRRTKTAPTSRRSTTAGGRTMGRRASDVEIEELDMLRRAFAGIGEMGTGGLRKMEVFADGLDIVFGRDAVEAFRDYRLTLLYKEFPPEVLTGLNKIEELFGEIATEATKWIAHLKDVLEEDIKAAKRLRGSGPSVGVLAG